MNTRVDHYYFKSGKIEWYFFQYFPPAGGITGFIDDKERTIATQHRSIVQQLFLLNLQMKHLVQQSKSECSISTATAKSGTGGDGFMQVHLDFWQIRKIFLE